MARLGEITEEQFNSTVHPTAITKLIRPGQVVDVRDQGGKGVVIYKKANSNSKQRRITTELRAALLTEFNVDEGTLSGVTTLAVTVKQEDNVVFTTPLAKNIAIDNIIEVQADVNDATDSRIEYQKFSGKTRILIVDETVAALKAAANA